MLISKAKKHKLLFIESAQKDVVSLTIYFHNHLYYEKKNPEPKTVFLTILNKEFKIEMENLATKIKFWETPEGIAWKRLLGIGSKLGEHSTLNPQKTYKRNSEITKEIEKLRNFLKKIPDGGELIYDKLPVDIKKSLKVTYPDVYSMIEKHLIKLKKRQ
ncbi:MAG: hypothetical protein L6Q77_00860 [Bacteroidetes bacterium]|nr:hypothetical protein [Bacteroidota bacterium]